MTAPGSNGGCGVPARVREGQRRDRVITHRPIAVPRAAIMVRRGDVQSRGSSVSSSDSSRGDARCSRPSHEHVAVTPGSRKNWSMAAGHDRGPSTRGGWWTGVNRKWSLGGNDKSAPQRELRPCPSPIWNDSAERAAAAAAAAAAARFHRETSLHFNEGNEKLHLSRAGGGGGRRSSSSLVAD